MRKTKNDSVTLSGGKTHAHLDYTALRKAVLVLRAVNHKLRQRIIDLLEEGNNMTVTDIYIKLRLEQSVASQHLAILRRSGVVSLSTILSIKIGLLRYLDLLKNLQINFFTF